MAVRIHEWAIITMKQMQGVSDVFRSFIPSEEGESIEDQIFPWNMEGMKENMENPLPIHEGDHQTIFNIMQMMSVEMQHWYDYHAYAKMTADEQFKSLLGQLARAEHVHHMRLMSLLPAPHDASEMVLQGEAALINAYMMCMNNEPNDAVKSACSRMCSDHMQHAQFAANRVQQLGCDPNVITGGMDLSKGTPIDKQLMKPSDTMWQGSFIGSYDKKDVDPQTIINVDMIAAGEMAAWDIYHCAMANTKEQDVRMNYSAFQSIEDQHVAIVGSLKDPSETPLERSLAHEQVEIVNYNRLMNSEKNDQVCKVFADLYREDLEHARLLGQFVS